MKMNDEKEEEYTHIPKKRNMKERKKEITMTSQCLTCKYSQTFVILNGYTNTKTEEVYNCRHLGEPVRKGAVNKCIHYKKEVQ